MKYNKGYLVMLTTALAIIANLLGRYIAESFTLPIWFDSLGTILVAYVYGPVCGAIVGLVNNIIYGIFAGEQSIYCFVGVFIGVVTGILSKKGSFESPFKVMTLGAILSLMCTALSVPLNIWLYDCMVANVWADQIILMCVNNSIPKIAACVIAQFYIEFLDKLICVYIVYCLIKVTRKKGKLVKKNAGGLMSAIALVVLFSGLLHLNAYAGTNVSGGNAGKAENDENYDSYTRVAYGSYEGLSAGEANDIVQTKEGKLWIGTYAGLYSYDGVKFTLHSDIDSVKNVNDLYIDEEGRLWIGTNDDGVTMMINGHVMNVVDVESGLLSNSIKNITCDSDGNYYIGSASGISIATLSSGVKVVKSFPEIKNTVRLSADEDGRVLAVTDNGEVYSFKDGELADSSMINADGNIITSVFFAKTGELYVGTDTDSVFVYSDIANSSKKQKIVCTGLDTVNAFYETENGEIFICSDSGVGYLDKSKKYNAINTENFANSIDNMIVDYQGNLWFASSRQGLLKMCKTAFTSLFDEVAEGPRVVNAVLKSRGKLLCGTDTGLLIIDEQNKNSITNELTEFFDNMRIRNINYDVYNNLWVSTTGNGLYKVTESGDSYDFLNFNETNGMPGKRVRCSIEVDSKEIVAVGDEGIAFIENDAVTKTITAKDGLINIKSLCVLEYNGKIYVGSDGGGITVIKDGAVSQKITKEEGLSSDVILRMVYDEKTGGVFIVTSNGLCYMSPDNHIEKLDKFPYSNNFDIIPGPDESMWILSSAGIYVADITQLIDNKDSEYELLNFKRGFRSSLTANSYSYENAGNLYLCCDNDVVKVDIDDYNFSAKSYRMSLKSVNVDGYDYEIDRSQPLVIDADAYNIIFTPQILNYSLNDPYISYCLEGVDAEEKILLLSELKSITYSNLKPGKYTFKISVLDSNKEDIIETGNYVIIKEMEMYQNWWFRLYIILVAAIIIIWATWFITRSRIQKTVLQQKLELEYAKKQLEMGNETILSIARTVDAKDSNTSEHSFRVSQYSVAIAKRYGFDEKKSENIRQMALLHDIGKIGIPDAILNKPAKLNDDEYEIMKSHVIRGGEILKDFTLIENVNIGALYHHERYDGKGYCVGLKGEEIPIEARIIGIADAFDAMTANRVYRKQLDMDFVIAELKRCRGTQFDPTLTDIMLSLIEEGVIDIEKLYQKSKEGR